jgi:putative ABC transport system permease protein
MIAADTVQLALRNLGQSKLRTAITTLGVAIGIASLAGMVSLGVGIQDQVVGRLMKSGVFDAVTVTPRTGGLAAALGMGRGGREGRSGPLAELRGRRAGATPDKPAPPLDDDAIAKMAALPGVKDVYPNLRVPVEMKHDLFTETNVATGVPMSSKDEGAFQTITYGTFFANDTDNACLLSLDLAKQIDENDPKSLIGQTLTLAHAAAAPSGLPQRVETPYTIVGIVEREQGPNMAGAGVSGLMIPEKKADEIDANMPRRPVAPQSLIPAAGSPAAGTASAEPAAPVKRTFQSVTVRVTHAQATQDVEDKIKALGYGAFSLTDLMQGFKRGFIILDIFLSLIGSIALAVSSLGIVNTMVMSILERTREIGIMKAIGGSDGDIRKIFLVEASAIGVMGGVFGVALGWLVGRVINFGANIYIQNQGGTPGNLFSLPLWLIGGAIGFSWLVSLIAGSYPASRAAKLDPIHALRHD